MKLQFNKEIRRKMATDLQRVARLGAGAKMMAGVGSTGAVLALTAARWVVCQGLAYLLLAIDDKGASRSPKARDE